MTKLRKALKNTRKLRRQFATATFVELDRIARLNRQAEYIEALIDREISR